MWRRRTRWRRGRDCGRHRGVWRRWVSGGRRQLCLTCLIGRHILKVSFHPSLNQTQAVLGGDWHTVVEHHLPGLFFSPPQAQGQAHACFLVRRQQYLEALLSSMLSQTPSTDEEVGEQEEKEDTVPSTSPSPLALLRGPVATACAQLPPEVGPQILHSLSLLLLLLPPPPPLVVSDGKKHNSNGVVVIAGMTPQERAALLCRAAGWAGGGEAGRRALLKCVRTLAAVCGVFVRLAYVR